MSSSKSESMSTSEEVRTKGNEFYKVARLQTIPFYQRAAELSPTDRTPWSNLAAAHFELGDYRSSISACEKAMSLLSTDNPDHDAVKEKLHLRMAKSFLHTREYDAAAKVVDRLNPSMEKYSLERCVGLYLEAEKLVLKPEKVAEYIVLNLPRYKPTLINTADTTSLLFGGIGDARNLFQTLVEIARHEAKKKDIERKKYHFTIIDLKAACIARILVVVMMLEELSQSQEDEKQLPQNRLLHCLFYTLLSPLMPAKIYDVLQTQISRAVEALEGQGGMPDYLSIPEMYTSDVLRFLKDWKNSVQAEFPTARVQQQLLIKRQQEDMQWAPQRAQDPEAGRPLPVCRKEAAFHAQTGAVLLSPVSMRVVDPEIQKYFDDLQPREINPQTVPAAARAAVKAHWRTNVTLFDLEWMYSRANDEGERTDIDTGESPYTIAAKIEELGIKPRGAQCLYDYVATWLIQIAQAIRQLRGRFQVEACVGDLTAVLEQIKYGVVGHRSHAITPESVAVKPHAVAAAVQNDYPQLYDRIHLSNVPDYIGGTLTSYLYALPMVYPGPQAYITSTCLRNPPRFPSAEAFDAEYTGLHKPSDMEKIFHVALERTQDYNMDAMMGMMPMCAYLRWHHQGVSTEYKDLMPRSQLETWIYRPFLKLVLPVAKEDIVSNTLIYCPLNLTVIFRILGHLQEIGYPAHWLSDILSSILSGSITTTARPPRSEPLKPKEIDTIFPTRKQTLAPFMAEFSTLASMWQQYPFGANTNFVPLDKIKQYTVKFRKANFSVRTWPGFILVFHKKMLSERIASNLRQYLLDDEAGFKNNKTARILREKEIHVVST
ncbi:putative tetratricopeptide-like protein [Zymoseptoria brevis]|uniref:Putative tetratricopeptide-like protein n=1 Tax=Zymoseptoria brevis TaxID=1047168 RepID=A0A0F4GGY2_9PEZI|nr:putative tetratricopeptide-like protein [Zymoseptoria brevis]